MLSAHRHDKDHRMLFNPLSAEFGVRTAEEMDSFISSSLPDFKLVKFAKVPYWLEGMAPARRWVGWQECG